MCKQIILTIILLILYSCEKSVSEKTESNPDEINPSLTIDTLKSNNPKFSNLYGNWVGDFEADESADINKGEYVFNNKLNLIVEQITDDNKIFGKSVVAGNYRDFSGELVVQNDGEIRFIVSEPGDQKYDGIFNLTYYPKNDSIGGIWEAKNKNIPVIRRIVKLKKKEFKYNANNMLPSEQELSQENSEYTDWYNSKPIKNVYEGEEYTEVFFRSASKAVTTLNGSTQKLTDNDLKNLRKLDLEIIRNTIYARHGFTFGKKAVRQFFDWVDWYIPISNDVSKELSQLEKNNIALLKRYEKYAEDNYDTFGR